jgi:hypothetical protein
MNAGNRNGIACHEEERQDPQASTSSSIPGPSDLVTMQQSNSLINAESSRVVDPSNGSQAEVKRVGNRDIVGNKEPPPLTSTNTANQETREEPQASASSSSNTPGHFAVRLQQRINAQISSEIRLETPSSTILLLDSQPLQTPDPSDPFLSASSKWNQDSRKDFSQFLIYFRFSELSRIFWR